MNILIIGSGGREHALLWKLRQCSGVDRVFVAPGNGGTIRNGGTVPIRDDDISALTAFALEQNIDLVVPGPELPLTLGIVDAMAAEGIACFGPSAACARLEGSKAFAKEIMRRGGVPTAAWGTFSCKDDAVSFVKNHGAPLVIKADGLAAGKGVLLCFSEEEALHGLDDMFSGRFGDAGQTVVIEEFLEGEEVSLLCFCDGETALPLPSAQDHKAVNDGDTGPNTGGMGAYSPAPILPDSELEAMTDIAIRPVLKVMAEAGTPYTGILYAGLMITADGPKVLEYNVRFGDPECQPLLMRLDSNLAEILMASVTGDLAGKKLQISPKAALGVVLAARGYPGDYDRGMLITGIDKAEGLEGVKVFQAGTRMENGEILSNGGRILCVTALGEGLKAAQAKAYEALGLVRMDKGHYRTDIGDKGVRRL